jgi:sec-independent protein translocase protein TatA
MGGLSIWHWLIIGAVALLLFGGAGKLSGLMGDAAKGVKAFKQGLKDDDEPETEPRVAPVAQALPAAEPAAAAKPAARKRAPAKAATKSAAKSRSKA